MKYPHRYDRNMRTLSPEENEKLQSQKVCVVGCGGLGGYVIEMLGRLGVGYITVVDGDVFQESNLNRQLFAEEALLGTSKARAAVARMALINSEVHVRCEEKFLTEENCEEIIGGHDLVIDALDNMSVRKILEKCCEKLEIPLIHGAIAGWFGQVATIFPGDKTLDKIYPCDKDKGSETELGTPSFTPALIAAIEVAEAVKVLLTKGISLRSRMLTVDLLMQEYEIFDL